MTTDKTNVKLTKAEDFDAEYAEYEVLVDGVRVGKVKKGSAPAGYYDAWRYYGLRADGVLLKGGSDSRKRAVAELVSGLGL